MNALTRHCPEEPSSSDGEQQTSEDADELHTSDDMESSPTSDEMGTGPSSDDVGSLHGRAASDRSSDDDSDEDSGGDSGGDSEEDSEDVSSPNGDYSASMEEEEDDHISYAAQGSVCGIQAKLVALVLNRKWDELRAELGRAHEQRLWPTDEEGSPLSPTFDDNGCTAFHYLCWSPHAPQDVVLSLLALYRTGQPAILDKPVHRKFSPSDLRLFPFTPAGRMSPVHLACYNGSPSTLQLLLELKAQHNSFLVDGRARYSRFDALLCEFALQADPGCGMTPLEAIWEPFFRDKSRRKNFDRIHSEAAMDAETKTMWDKTKILLRATTMGPRSPTLPHVGSRRYLPLHAIASISSGGEIRRLVLQLVLKIFPQEPKERDYQGNLPLHLACQILGRETALIYNGKEFKTPVELLVKSYPDAARVRNNDGRLPLHLATESNKSWDEEIRFLVDAAPIALQSRDPLTGMYPFMLSAVKIDEQPRYRKHTEFDLDQGREVEYLLVPVVQDDLENVNTKPELDSIYRLLRSEPAVVGCGISNNPYESYLVRQVARLEDSVLTLQAEQKELKSKMATKEKEWKAATIQAESEANNLKERIASLEDQLRKRKREDDDS